MNENIKIAKDTIYIDDKYPDKLLRKKSNGQIESVKYNELDREIIVLEVLEHIDQNEELQNKKIASNISL